MVVVGVQELEIPATGSTKIGGRGRGEVRQGEKSNLARGEEVKKQRGCDGERLILGDTEDVKIDREVERQ